MLSRMQPAEAIVVRNSTAIDSTIQTLLSRDSSSPGVWCHQLELVDSHHPQEAKIWILGATSHTPHQATSN
eukprot:scaffold8554_cov91-Skeletonema_dohrnii-CCMP3373.AAC.2